MNWFDNNYEHDLMPVFLAPTVNRCRHKGGPEHMDCGCSLDFECKHGGTCETQAECQERPT